MDFLVSPLLSPSGVKKRRKGRADAAENAMIEVSDGWYFIKVRIQKGIDVQGICPFSWIEIFTSVFLPCFDASLRDWGGNPREALGR